jgi:hypothetical protein
MHSGPAQLRPIGVRRNKPNNTVLQLNCRRYNIANIFVDRCPTFTVDILNEAIPLEQRLVLLELSQKAASIYRTRTPEQKRLIITKLFTNITRNQGALSVTYTDFSRAIAQNVLKTKEILGAKK